MHNHAGKRRKVSAKNRNEPRVRRVGEGAKHQTTTRLELHDVETSEKVKVRVLNQQEERNSETETRLCIETSCIGLQLACRPGKVPCGFRGQLVITLTDQTWRAADSTNDGLSTPVPPIPSRNSTYSLTREYCEPGDMIPAAQVEEKRKPCVRFRRVSEKSTTLPRPSGQPSGPQGTLALRRHRTGHKEHPQNLEAIQK